MKAQVPGPPTVTASPILKGDLAAQDIGHLVTVVM
jgi:hypothetical protein